MDKKLPCDISQQPLFPYKDLVAKEYIKCVELATKSINGEYITDDKQVISNLLMSLTEAYKQLEIKDVIIDSLNEI